MRRAGQPWISLLVFALPGCGSLTGRLWSDFPEYRIETTTHRVEDAALHLARPAEGPASRGSNGQHHEPELLAVHATIAGLPESWKRLLSPFGGTAGSRRVGWLVFRGSMRARVITALLGGSLGLEPESCAAVFRQGTGTDDERQPLKVPLVIQGRLPPESVGEILRTDEVSHRLPELPSTRPADHREKGQTSAAEHFAWKPWLYWLGDQPARQPKEEVRYHFVAFTDKKGLPVKDPMRVDRLVRWGGTPEEMASLRDVFAFGVAKVDHEVRCYVLVPARVLVLAIAGEIGFSGSSLWWEVETEWRVGAHTHVPEDVELAGAPIRVPNFEVVFQTRTRVEGPGLGRTLGRILLTPLTITLDVVTIGLAAAMRDVLADLFGEEEYEW